MSRGMLMTVLARYAGESTEGGTVWYEKGMNWAKSKGISDGSAPNRNITREQLAAMLYRYAGELDGAADLSAYTDAGSVSAYAEKAVQWCVKNGILTGKTSSVTATRARSARRCCSVSLHSDCRETTVSPTSRNGPWAVPKSSESSARWLKLSPSGSIKICAILARFLDRAALIHAPRFYGLQCNPIECALTREENEKATV